MDLPCRQQQKQQQQQQCACLLSVRGGRGSILNAWHSDSFIGSAAPFGTFGSTPFSLATAASQRAASILPPSFDSVSSPLSTLSSPPSTLDACDDIPAPTPVAAFYLHQLLGSSSKERDVDRLLHHPDMLSYLAGHSAAPFRRASTAATKRPSSEALASPPAQRPRLDDGSHSSAAAAAPPSSAVDWFEHASLRDILNDENLVLHLDAPSLSMQQLDPSLASPLPVQTQPVAVRLDVPSSPPVLASIPLVPSATDLVTLADDHHLLLADHPRSLSVEGLLLKSSPLVSSHDHNLAVAPLLLAGDSLPAGSWSLPVSNSHSDTSPSRALQSLLDDSSVEHALNSSSVANAHFPDFAGLFEFDDLSPFQPPAAFFSEQSFSPASPLKESTPQPSPSAAAATPAAPAAPVVEQSPISKPRAASSRSRATTQRAAASSNKPVKASAVAAVAAEKAAAAAPSASSDSDGAQELDAGDLPQRKLSRRERNNIAVRRCRDKNREKSLAAKSQCETVAQENANLRVRIHSLEQEVSYLKSMLLSQVIPGMPLPSASR
ncbi:hypothetical protein CAOG_02294 [Capsaspora owczarzaki ATCC 30864]|uniref:hypothetical protein n=1 Tax=Capsaspora owczarzaki (strain ATCC 30864) TaxID=595528 RepID=UPI0001FE3281|nr:hypothetical protein CAOG_02294 [Capsaspora owczarzaki ATCC 30864]|eukprot:XP_004349044.1 hypothetical protein CAOG_02294 [Capsaspora owczarzaki ATCC 30864]